MRPRIGVILAGGQSSRMGATDKAEVLVGSKRLIEHVTELLTPQCDEVLLSASHDYGLNFTFIKDDKTMPGGPAGGILSIAKALLSRPHPPKGFFTVPVDGPNLPANFCELMFDTNTSTLAMDDVRTHPSFAWWRLLDIRQVMDAIAPTDSLSLHHLARICNARSILWSEPNLFFNINTANDLSNYLTDTISEDND